MAQNESLKLSVTVNRRLEKYGDQWSQEQIDAGEAVPYEVLDDQEEVFMTVDELLAAGYTREQLVSLGVIKEGDGS